VAIENCIWQRFPQRSHYRRPDRQIRNKVAVHNVHVQQCSAAFECLLGVLGQPRKICGQNRRREFNRSWQFLVPRLYFNYTRYIHRPGREPRSYAAL
jgi:hypothetical protein